MDGYNPSGKVQLVGSRPPLAPGDCIMCGAGERREGFADVGRDLEFFGVIYFCGLCALEIASAFGGIGPKQASELNDEIVLLSAEVERLREQLNERNDDLLALRRVLSLSAPVGSVDQDADIPAEQGDGEVRETVSSGETEEPTITESVNGEGPNDDPSTNGSELQSFGI